MTRISTQPGSRALMGSLIARILSSRPPAASSRLPTQETQPPGSMLMSPPLCTAMSSSTTVMYTAAPMPSVRTASADLNQSPSLCSGPRYMSRNATAMRARTSAKSWTSPG